MAVQEKASQAGGQPRFKGAGRLWKTGWKSPTFIQELCCVSNFQSSPDVWYQNPSVLPLDPLAGFFVGAIVGISDSGVSTLIASNGGVNNEGWNLKAVPVIGSDSVEFIFEMGDGTVYASAGVTLPLYTEGEEQMLGTDTRYFVVLGGYAPESTITNGILAVAVGTTGDPAQAPTRRDFAQLANPYVNSSPFFYLGGGPQGLLTPPNCIAGLVGGRGVFADTVNFDAVLAGIADEWALAVQAASRVVEVPPQDFVPGFANEHGYRIPTANPGTPAPDPWLDFIDAEPLTLIQDGDPLVTSCAPLLFDLDAGIE